MKAEPIISDELLALVCCPETRQRLARATPEVVSRLEARRLAGSLRNRGGLLIDAPIEAGLVREDGMLFFPIRSGIPLLVTDEAVSLSEP